MSEKIDVSVHVPEIVPKIGGTRIGVKIPEKVAIFGMKVSTKILLAILALMGLSSLVYIAMMYRGFKPSQQSTKESRSLQA